MAIIQKRDSDGLDPAASHGGMKHGVGCFKGIADQAY